MVSDSAHSGAENIFPLDPPKIYKLDNPNVAVEVCLLLYG